MRTEICDQLGIEFPIFAFSHCRDVVAAVSKTGGLGVLGAVGFDPDQLRSFTGKPCRMLRNHWTEAWERPDTPEPLPMPLQMMVALDAVQRGHRYPRRRGT